MWQKSRDEGWEEAVVLDGWLLAGMSALLFGRAGYIIFHAGEFGGSWYKMVFFIQYPGLSGEAAWLGGLILLLLWGWWRRLDFWLWLEAVIPAVLAVEIFARVGSFLAGSGGGTWPAAQLAAAGGLILGWRLIGFWEKRYREWNFKAGSQAAVYLILTGMVRAGLIIGNRQPLPWWWAAAIAAAGGLILWRRSGITIKAPVKRKLPARKKRGFDYA